MHPPEDPLTPHNVLSMFLEELQRTAQEVGQKLGLRTEAPEADTAALSADELTYYRAAVGTPEAHDRLVELVLQASQDGLITAAEIAKIDAVRHVLGISEAELSSIKLAVLGNLVSQLRLAGLVRTEDMKLIGELTRGLQFRPEDGPALEALLLKLRDLER